MDEQASPIWFQEDVAALRCSRLFQDAQAVGPYLSALRREMLDGLSNFQSQVRYTISMLLALISVAGGLFAFVVGQSGAEETVNLLSTLRFVSAALLLAVVPISILATNVIAQSFKLYVSTVIYAYEAHAAARVPGHPWFEWFDQYFAMKPTSRQHLVSLWLKDPTGQFVTYVGVLLVTDVLCIVGSILLLFQIA